MNLANFKIRLYLAVFCLSVIPANAHGDAPVEIEVFLEQSILVVGEPLVIEIRATNVSSSDLDNFRVRSSFFTLSWFLGFAAEGCEPGISIGDQLPPLPPVFSFDWELAELRPGEAADCRITFPQTLFPGRETIQFSSRIDGVAWPDLAQFTYSLLPPSGAPFLVEAGFEDEITFTGDAMVMDMQVTNLGSETLGPFPLFSSDINLISAAGHIADGCELEIDDILPAPGFLFSWTVPALQPGDRVNCQVTFTETPNTGDEIIRLSSMVDDALWEEVAVFGYRLLPSASPPVEIEVDLERSVLVAGEPLVFEIRATNVSPNPLGSFWIMAKPFFLTEFFPVSLEGCTFFQDFFGEIRLFGWPLWRPDELRQGSLIEWNISGLYPGETVSCRVTAPLTLSAGQDTAQLTAWIDEIPWRSLATFSYTVLESGIPLELSVNLEQSTLVVGEPLVIDIQATNIGAEALERVSIFHLDDFQLASFNGITAEGCELTIAAPEPLPGMALPGEAFFLDFQDLQAGETATCRVTLPQTLTPGQETIRLAGSGDGVFWGELAAFTYVLRGAELAPVPVPTNTRAWLLFAILMLLVIGVNRIHADQAKSHRDF